MYFILQEILLAHKRHVPANTLTRSIVYKVKSSATPLFKRSLNISSYLYISKKHILISKKSPLGSKAAALNTICEDENIKGASIGFFDIKQSYGKVYIYIPPQFPYNSTIGCHKVISVKNFQRTNNKQDSRLQTCFLPILIFSQKKRIFLLAENIKKYLSLHYRIYISKARI